MKIAFDLIILLRLEVLDLLLPLHNQRQGRNLDPANPESRFISVPAGIHCIGPRKIHADQPVSPFPAKTCCIERFKLLVILDAVKGPCQAHGILGMDQQTLYGSLVTEIFQDFIDKQLAFTVRIPRMDDRITFFQQPTDNLQLFLAIGCRMQFPGLGENRIILPELIFFAVFLRLRESQDMAKRPAHAGIALCDEALAFLGSIRPEIASNGTADVRFFGQIKICILSHKKLPPHYQDMVKYI